MTRMAIGTEGRQKPKPSHEHDIEVELFAVGDPKWWALKDSNLRPAD